MHVARSMHPLSDKRMKFPRPPSHHHHHHVSRTHQISPLPPLLGPVPSLLAISPLHPLFPLAYPSAGRCVQFADVKCNIHLSPHFRGVSHALSSLFSCFADSLPPPRDDLWTVYTSSTSTCVYRARTRSLSTRVNHDSEGFEGTTEERVTMRTGRPKIGRHACMWGFAGPSRISDVLWMTGRAL